MARQRFLKNAPWATHFRLSVISAGPFQILTIYNAGPKPSHEDKPTESRREPVTSPAAESSADIRARVERARARQQERGFYNSRMPTRLIRKHCALNDAGERTLEMAVRRLGLSARAHDRILKVGRTISDLDESDRKRETHRRSGAISQPGPELLDINQQLFGQPPIRRADKQV